MSLPINPLARLVANASNAISQATNEASAAMANAATEFSKLDLDATVNRLSQSVGAGGAGFQSGIAQLGQLGAGLSQAASRVGGVISTLQSSVGSIANITSDIAGGLNKLGAGNLASGIAQLAGGISRAAGVLNNLLSLKRGANLPAGAESFKQYGQAIQLQPGTRNDWRVRINTQWNLFDSPLFKRLESTGGVVFPYLPNITFSTKANYTAIEPVHNNYPFQAYKNSQVDEITIAGDFSCETASDAAYWISATTFFKTATKMFFGQGPNAGNPPPICILSGYGTSMFNNTPVIIKSFSVDLKDDVDYINCDQYGTNTWVPILSTITITVQPIYNRTRLRKFSLQDYSRGAITNGVGYL